MGYKVGGVFQSDSAMSVLLNATTGPGAATTFVDPQLSSAVYNQIDTTERLALSASNQTVLSQLLSMGTVDVRGANTRTALSTLFPTATAPITHANLVAFFSRAASRAEVLFGANTVVLSADVARALGRF